MKTTLSNLPQNKQDQLKALTQITLEKSRPNDHPLRQLRAWRLGRGLPSEDEYVSDFDILIVTKYKNSAKQVKESRELEREFLGDEDFTRTGIIYHSIDFANDKIERNYYLFVNILKVRTKNLNAAQRGEKLRVHLSTGLNPPVNFWWAFNFTVKKIF